MIDDQNAVELYRKHRPSSLGEVVGQIEAIEQLKAMGMSKSMPHALLFVGPSGTGKTTLARIVARNLRCTKDANFREINCGSSRGIETIRDIEGAMGYAPVGGDPCRVIMLDEVHHQTSEAQTALLKLLEDCPAWVYFILCTTDPAKLKPTILTRCTKLVLKPLSVQELKKDLTRIATKENKPVADEVIEKIAHNANGSARQAIVILHSIINLPAEIQLNAVEKVDIAKGAIDLARALIKKGTPWTDVSAILEKLEDDPESTRRLIIGYCKSVLKSGNLRAHLIIEEFREPLFDPGTASSLLMSSCFALNCDK